MEKFALTLQSKNEIISYQADNHLTRYELELLAEISAVIENKDAEALAWFAGFGDSFRQILMNVREHREALEFGFTEIAFNQYGWFAAPKFMDFEEIKLEQSSIRIGHGPNGVWAYSLSCNYGTAGSSGPLCVFCTKYPNREAALSAALGEMKVKMSQYIGNSDTTNYKQDVLQKTLKAIASCEVSMVQLTLF
ncbi:hypothetical protein [Mucilaginibacter sp. L3T2-6]|uniref:hypothetical protein n=1 Tax=Mucilaginibacter sp. L3T2-6 TaxID=3062491 RepID=UPI002675CC12|nr:hypothetical protein [Mucilaginibacter sp. L3T2-6]MDO3641343.1 hypothetical protein [Mucilaginibacter sp. L3T2-6]MDV6213896.1 hypothetical protein [Mucilaginibacter sp. L3T2-6]